MVLVQKIINYLMIALLIRYFELFKMKKTTQSTDKIKNNASLLT